MTTPISKRRSLGLTAFAACLTLPFPLFAQEPASPGLLPGGASSVIETHGDWTLRCEIITRTETSERICVVNQVQTNAQGQRVIAVELAPSADGVAGAIILPFGLAVTQPVTLTIDEGEPITASFSTCVPAGCVVPIEAGSETLNAMRAGSALSISTQNVDNQPLELPVSLAGFSAATNRVADLAQ